MKGKLKINYMEIRGKPKSKKTPKKRSQLNPQEPVKISEINAPGWRNCQTHRTINVCGKNKSTSNITLINKQIIVLLKKSKQ